jgi:hypothetical protein
VVVCVAGVDVDVDEHAGAVAEGLGSTLEAGAQESGEVDMGKQMVADAVVDVGLVGIQALVQDEQMQRPVVVAVDGPLPLLQTYLTVHAAQRAQAGMLKVAAAGKMAVLLTARALVPFEQ